MSFREQSLHIIMLPCELQEPRITTISIYMIKLPQSSINIVILRKILCR